MHQLTGEEVSDTEATPPEGWRETPESSREVTGEPLFLTFFSWDSVDLGQVIPVVSDPSPTESVSTANTVLEQAGE